MFTGRSLTQVEQKLDYDNRRLCGGPGMPALAEVEIPQRRVEPVCVSVYLLMFTGRSVTQVEQKLDYDVCRLCGDNTWKKVCVCVCVVVAALWRLFLLM